MHCKFVFFLSLFTNAIQNIPCSLLLQECPSTTWLMVLLFRVTLFFFVSNFDWKQDMATTTTTIMATHKAKKKRIVSLFVFRDKYGNEWGGSDQNSRNGKTKKEKTSILIRIHVCVESGDSQMMMMIFIQISKIYLVYIP